MNEPHRSLGSDDRDIVNDHCLGITFLFVEGLRMMLVAVRKILWPIDLGLGNGVSAEQTCRTSRVYMRLFP